MSSLSARQKQTHSGSDICTSFYIDKLLTQSMYSLQKNSLSHNSAKAPEHDEDSDKDTVMIIVIMLRHISFTMKC